MSATVLKQLGEQVRTLHNRIAAASDEIDDLLFASRERGETVETMPEQTARRLSELGAEKDRLTAELRKVNEAQHQTAEALGRAQLENGGSRGVGSRDNLRPGMVQRLPLRPPAAVFEELRQAATEKRSLRLGGGGFGHDILAAGPWDDRIDFGEARLAGAEALLAEPTRIADYIPAFALDQPAVAWMQQTAGATAAAPVAPGATKPESSPVWAKKTATARKIAHYSSFEDEIAQDVNGWQLIVGGAMIAGLVAAENHQILYGDGTGEQLTGLLETGGIGSVDRDTTNESRADALLRGITTVRTTAFVEPNVVILHPSDLLEVYREKASGSGEYLAGNPLSATASPLWGVPVVLTTDISQGTAVAANLAVAARVYFRQAPTFQVHASGGGKDEFTANVTLCRAEERLALTVPQPAAVCEIIL